KIDANGDAMWAVGGVVVCKAAGDQINPAAVADGAGGVIVAWEDGRTDALNPDLYAQRLTAAGVELWTTDGVLVSGAAGRQQAPAIVGAGMRGAIVAWRDDRTGAADIFARRVPANGVPAWTADGVAVSQASGDQDQVAAVSDGAGGAILAWRDTRGGN